MKVLVTKGGFKVKSEKGLVIYDLGGYISDGEIFIPKEYTSNLSELVLSDIEPSKAEEALKPLETIFENDFAKLKQVATHIVIENGQTDKRLSYVKLNINNVIQYVSLEMYEFLVAGKFILFTEAPLKPIYLGLIIPDEENKEIERRIAFGIAMPMLIYKPEI